MRALDAYAKGGLDGRHVVIVSAVYRPEPVVSARISFDLAAALATTGARVTVICPRPSRPMGIVYPEEAVAAMRPDAATANPRVITLDSYTAPRSLMLSRVRESWGFGRAAADRLTLLGPVDAVYANTWPLFGQWFVGRECEQNGIPFVLHVQDIYPEAAFHRIPALFRSLLSYPLLTFDRFIARLASRVVVNSESAANYYSKTRRLRRGKVFTVRNWNDDTVLATLPDRVECCRLYGIDPNRFTFLFLGNIGILANVERLITAFATARPPGAQLLIVGDGDRKESCEDLVRSLGLDDAKFISEPRSDYTPHLLALADVCLLSLQAGSGLGSVPSKLISYLLAGKPVLASVDMDSDTANCVTQSGAGWCGEPTDQSWLPAQLSRIAQLPRSELTSRGAAGRDYGMRRFSRTAGTTQLCAVIASSGMRPTIPSAGFRIVALSGRHLADAVALHRQAFPDFFLSQMGPWFLHELYRGYLRGPGCKALVAEDAEQRLVGVLLGTVSPGALYSRLLRSRGWAFALASIPAMLRRPSIVTRLMRGLRYRGTASGRPEGALLSSIAVNPQAQGRGIGRALVTAWLKEIRSSGCRQAYLTTDAENNNTVNRFYKSLGWTPESEYTTSEGRRMRIYAFGWPT